MVIDRYVLEGGGGIELPPQEESAVESAKSGDPGCFGWTDYTESRPSNVYHPGGAAAVAAGGIFTGGLSADLSFQSSGTVQVDYRVRRNFDCVPVKFMLTSLHAQGNIEQIGTALLDASSPFNGQTSAEAQVANLPLAHLDLSVGAIPIWVDFSMPVTLGVSIASIGGSMSQEFTLSGEGTFNFTCTTMTCTGSTSFVQPPVAGEVEASYFTFFDARADAKVEVRGAVWSGQLFTAQAGPDQFVDTDVRSYDTIDCGDADDDGQNDLVIGHLADSDAGYELSYQVAGPAGNFKRHHPGL